MGIGLLITGAAVLIAVILLFAVLGKAASKGKRHSSDAHSDAGGSGVWMFGSTHGDHSSGSDSSGSSDGGGGGGGGD